MSAPGRGARAVSGLLGGAPFTCARCARPSSQMPNSAIIAPPWKPSQTPSSLRVRPYSVEAAASASSTVEPLTPPPSTPSLLAPEGLDAGADADTYHAAPPPPSLPTRPDMREPSNYHISASLILSRPPLLTRPQHPFESAFYFYQKRLAERLTARFRPEFWFRPDTPPAIEWRLNQHDRRGVAGRDIGRYSPWCEWSWNDEVLQGSRAGDPAQLVRRLARESQVRVSEEGVEIPLAERKPVEMPMPRETIADVRGDTRRLDRRLDQTLYLVVKREVEVPGKKKGKAKTGADGKMVMKKVAKWRFPTVKLGPREPLHEGAERALAESCGVNMNTWIIGRAPVAHYVREPEFAKDEPSRVVRPGDKVFFLRGRIMAGQADLSDNALGLTDFQWLTRDELRSHMKSFYFSHVEPTMDPR